MTETNNVHPAVAALEGASRSPRMRFAANWSYPEINTLLSNAGNTLAARARHLTRNNAYARNAVEVFTSYAVGTGVKPNPQAGTPEQRDSVLELFRLWTDEADADGVTDFYGLQRRIAYEVFTTGECFVRFRERRPDDGLLVPLQLQIIPSEMCPVDHHKVLSPGRYIRNGIEFGALGEPVAYHMYRTHPGAVTLGITDGTLKRVPAREIMHIFAPEEAGQIRGLTRFASAIVRLFMLDQYDDAELDRKKTAAMFAGFVRRSVEAEPFETEDAEDPREGLLPISPGLIQYLNDNEDIQFTSPSDVGQQYEAFQYRALLSLSSALGIPYQVLTGDLKAANYSSARTGLLDFKRRVDTWVYSVLVYQFCRPLWHRWIETADLARATSGFRLPAGERERRTWLYAEWLPPRWDWVDPQKDVKAEIEQIAGGLKSRTQALHERGYDPEQVDRERAADAEREKRLGLNAPAPPSGKGTSPADDDEDDGEDQKENKP